MKTIIIKIGNDIRILKRIGLFIMLNGLLLFLITGIVLLIGYHMPVEISIVYYIEIINKNIFLLFCISILTMIIGLKLADWKNYVKTELKISDGNLMWINDGDEIELPIKKIYKLYWRKKILSKEIKLTIKTIGITKYETEIDIMNYSRLKNYLPDSKFEYKKLGN